MSFRSAISILVLSILVGFTPALWSQSKDQVYILCYHTFLGKDIATDFSVDEFKSHMQKIKDLGYRFVSWQDILSNRVKGPKNVLITIDDGNKTVIPAWEQVLRPMGIKPILFIYPNIIGKMSYAMKYSQLKELMAQGVTIGAHGYYHEYVNTKLFNKDPKAFWREIRTAKTTLEQNLDIPILTYAYPFGVYDTLTLKSVMQTRYDYAFKLGAVPQPLPVPPGESAFLLTRYLMTRGGWKSIYTQLKNAATEI